MNRAAGRHIVAAMLVVASAAVLLPTGGGLFGRPQETQPAATDYSTLYEWLCGSFSSEAQSKEDPTFLDIRMEMAPLWRERSDALWLYVEQARADALDRPYRQRIYQLIQSPDGEFESRVYELPGDDPLRYAGAHLDASRLAGVRKEDLKLKEGCSIFLRRLADGTYEGSTRGKGCASKRQGAAYTTSEVRLSADRMVTWDRGWDAAGTQVWGATGGGYIFRRVK